MIYDKHTKLSSYVHTKQVNWCKGMIKEQEKKRCCLMKKKELSSTKMIGCLIHEYLRKAVGFRNNINKHDQIFHNNIRAYTLLGVGYVAVRQTPCSYPASLRKLPPHII